MFEAIGKYINPTRYRQIIETASSDRLTIEEQSIISKDQKHRSTVAEVSYKKRLSRDIATQGKACMEKLVGEQREITNNAVSTVISDIRKTESTFGISILPTDTDNIAQEESALITGVNDVCINGKDDCIITNDHEIKTEPVDETTHRRIMFTSGENEKLREGIAKFGRGQWSQILAFGADTFDKVRTRDSLRMRANTMGFKRTYKC